MKKKNPASGSNGFKWVKQDLLGKFRPGEVVFFPKRIGLNTLSSQIPAGFGRFGHDPPEGENHLSAETCSSKQLTQHGEQNLQKGQRKS